MRFSTEQSAFAAAVKRAISVIRSRSTIPILECLHIKATDTGVAIFGTNLDEWVTVKFSAAVAEPGEICVEGGLLSAWLAAATKGSLVEFTLADHRVTLTAGRAVASFATFPEEGFPVPSARDAAIEVPNAIEAMRTVAPYASTEEMRYYLCGVAISQGSAVATNGQILCAMDIAAPDDMAVIIPTAGVRQIAQSGEGAWLFVGERTWACEDGAVVMGGKLIEGTFPDWKRILPKDQPVIATVDADALASGVAQVQIASGDRAKAIVFEGDGTDLSLSCRGHAMDASVAVPYEGEAFRTGLNSKYALIAMTTFAGRVVTMAGEIDAPLMMTCDAVPGLVACVFPMRV